MRPKAILVRLVRRTDGEVVAQPAGQGRGAYVCPDQDCVARMMKPGRLAQAFRQACHPAAGLREAIVSGTGA